MAELGYFVVPSSSEKDLGQRYLLVQDICVEHSDLPKQRNRNKKFSASKLDLTQHLKGTLLREVNVVNGDITTVRYKILCKHSELGTYFQCLESDVKPINESVYDLLLAVPNCRDRYDIYQNQVRLAEGLEMTVGTEVSVKVPNTSGEVQGIIRYKGFVYDKHGTHFGVELHEPDGRGNTNGTYGKQRYFNCDPDCGVFLPLNRVHPLHSEMQSPVAAPRRSKQSKMSASSSRSRNETCPNTLNISTEELNRLGIRFGMEVYIFTEVNGEESQEKGKVKFIGRLPGNKSLQDIYVGIDLDKAVGNGTGLYNGKHLFYTSQNHAALVPLSGVLPAYINDTQSETSERNHVYQDVDEVRPSTSELSSRTSQKDYNGYHRRGYNTEEIPRHSQKIFQETNRNVHSSPGILGTSRSRLNRLEENPVSSMSMSRSRHSLMDVENANSTQESQSNGDLRRSGNQYKKQRSNQSRQQSSRSSTLNRLLRDNSAENNSEDELPTLLDLYGSNDSMTMSKVTDRKDLYSHKSEPIVKPSMSSQLRPRMVNSVPGHYAAARNHRFDVPPSARQALTAPSGMSGKLFREDIQQNTLGELVEYNSIRNEFHNSSRDHADMEVGSMVQVTEGLDSLTQIGPTYGVIKWIGSLPRQEETVAGIEFDSAVANGTDGTFRGIRYFTCEYGRGKFVFLKFCRKDPRFSMPVELGAAANSSIMSRSNGYDFGNFESPRIPGSVAPSKKLDIEMIGKEKGIQGHHNSCYLDSTLFSLFAYSQVLDTILFRKKTSNDLPEYEETQKVLKELIINPLRKHHFVRADRIMQLRELLDKLGSVTGLVSEEKDPEEFLNTLLVQVFKAEPLIELRQGDSNAAHEGYFYQIFMEKDEKMGTPSTQQLLEKSVISADLKFRNVPVCLILQMPRFGKDYKMYKKLRPSLTLDITDLVEDMPRNCDICEGVAEFECRDCFLEGSLNEFTFSYCKNCVDRVHTHRKRKSHNYRAIKLPDEFREYADECSSKDETVLIERQKLELFAVVCIATSHYVSFAKCGNGRDATWCFFDSMADRIGEQSGYNIPEVTHCPDVGKWLQMDERQVSDMDEKLMPELMRRLLCDAYMCMYQSTDLMFNK